MPRKRRNSLEERILRGLEEVHGWVKGETSLVVHLPDGTTKQMNREEWEAWRHQRCAASEGSPKTREQ